MSASPERTENRQTIGVAGLAGREDRELHMLSAERDCPIALDDAPVADLFEGEEIPETTAADLTSRALLGTYPEEGSTPFAAINDPLLPLTLRKRKATTTCRTTPRRATHPNRTRSITGS